MNIPNPHPRRCRPHALAAAALIALATPLLPVPAPAQPAAMAAPALQIRGADVEPVERLVPGAELAFTVWATPGAQVTLQIPGAERSLPLAETRPGVFQGRYVISQHERIAPDAQVSIETRAGTRWIVATLDEPLERGWQAPVPAAGAPQIDRFSVTLGGDGRGGDVLTLRVDGTPGARVSVALPGAETRRIRLDEAARGQYVARYPLSADDDLRLGGVATARLQRDGRRVEAQLPRPFAGMTLRPAYVAGAGCADCAVVVALRAVDAPAGGAPVGTIAGGLLGAVVGSQFGKGDGRTAAGIAGAVGGALIGREIDRRPAREVQEVVLQMDSGERRTLTIAALPGLRVGDAVRVTDGRIEPRAD